MTFPSVSIPIFTKHCNLAIFPCEIPLNVSICCKKNVWVMNLFSIKGSSCFYFVTNDSVKPEEIAEKLSIEFLPGHSYCFYPNLGDTAEVIELFEQVPRFLSDFQFCLDIGMVSQ